MNCIACGAYVTPDEAGLNKKLIAKHCTEFLCIGCLAKKFGVTKERLREKMREYQAMGCLLFSSPKQKNEPNK